MDGASLRFVHTNPLIHQEHTMNNVNTNQSAIPAIGRILLAAIFIISGFGKVMAPAGTIGYIESSGLPFAPVAFAVAVAVELGGGLLLVAGIKTRLVAAILAAFSIVTAFAFHGNVADQNQMIHLLKNIAMAGGLLQVVAFGAGAWSVDAIGERKTQGQAVRA
jgi:putative oxidoreductase